MTNNNCSALIRTTKNALLAITLLSLGIGFVARASASCLCDCGVYPPPPFEASSMKECISVCGQPPPGEGAISCYPIPPPEIGTLQPKYYILSVVYAPPGSSGSTNSSVAYAEGSSMGSIVSISESFSDDKKLSAVVSGNIGVASGSIGGDYSYSRSKTNESAMDIKKGKTLTITVPGGNSDGIDHDRDVIYLWLNPQVKISVRKDIPGIETTTGSWTFVPGSVVDIQYVRVRWLKNPEELPPDVATRLAARGIGAEDYAAILQQVPFAMGSTPIDTNRFRKTLTTFPYEPPYAAGEASPSLTYNQTNQTISTSSVTAQTKTSMGVTAAGSAQFLKIWKAEAKVSDTWTWTNTSKTTTSAGATESATVTVGGPSFGYQGFTDIAVYVDTIYNTFMFAPAPVSMIGVFGAVVDKSGKPAAGKEVLLKVKTLQGPVVLRTFTNARGRYRFYEPPSGDGVIQVGTKVRTLAVKPIAVGVPLIKLQQ